MLVRMLVPMRMMRIYPSVVMVVPPVAIMPFVKLVEIAFIAPFGMIFGPLGMMTVEPAAIVVMPPVRLVPIAIRAVCAPSFVARQLSPGLGMVIHELSQVRMPFPPFPVVNQVRISLEIGLYRGTFVNKVVQALFVVVLSRRNRRHRHREENDRTSKRAFEM